VAAHKRDDGDGYLGIGAAEKRYSASMNYLRGRLAGIDRTREHQPRIQGDQLLRLLWPIPSVISIRPARL
jgi:hypothetical protein